MPVPRCRSIIVDLALKFNSTTKEQDVIITLNDAVENGKLGEFNVSSIKGTRPDVKPTSRGPTTPTDSPSEGKSLYHFLQNFCKLINECPSSMFDWKHIFW